MAAVVYSIYMLFSVFHNAVDFPARISMEGTPHDKQSLFGRHVFKDIL